MRSTLFAILALAAGCVGSDLDDPNDLGSVDEALQQSNGKNLNGTSLNGKNLNGAALNGRSLNGKNLNGPVLGGFALTGVYLDGSQLRGTLRGAAVSGAAIVGAELQGVDDSGTVVRLRIDRAAALAAPNDDVWSYNVSWLSGAGWQPICGLGDGGAPVGAIALDGRWDLRDGVKGGGDHIVDPGIITFGCRAIGATAKCVEMGYKPWRSVHGVSLASYHQACTRMVRADLCGNGHSYTRDGRLINVYDGLGVQVRDSTMKWAFEAEWTPSGARCMSVDLRDRLLSNIGVPLCALGLVNLTCGNTAHFATGTLVMDEVSASELKIGL